MRIESTVFLGTPLSGPRPLGEDNTAAEGQWIARARFAFDPGRPPIALPLLAQSATLVADTQRSAPVRGVAASTAGARRGSAGDLHDDLIWVGEVESAVVSGGTTRLSLEPNEGPGPLVALEVHLVEGGEPTWSLAAAAADGAVDRLLLTDPPTAAAVALWIPEQRRAEFGSIVAELSIEPVEDPTPAELAGPAQYVRTLEPELAAAIGATAGPRPRAALVLLADRTDCDIARDLALIADDELLAEALAAADVTAATDVESLGFRLETQLLLLLAGRATDGELSPELDSVLLRHTGELGRLPSSLADAVRGESSRAALDARLVAENRLLLEDPDPGARRRALQWLAGRDLAPAGFDPLAPNAERRRALADDERRRAEAAGEAR